MNLQILICHNAGITRERAEKLSLILKAYFEQNTPLQAEIDYREVSLQQLTFKVFTRGLFGLDGIKERIRDIKVPANTFHVVGFLYDYDALAEKPDREHIAAWTYPNSLYSKEAFFEFPVSTTWPDFNDSGPFHENVHCMHRRCQFEGVRTMDTMDTHKENVIYTILGNLAENLAQLMPNYPVITKIPGAISAWGQLILALSALLAVLLPKKALDIIGLVPKPPGTITRGYEEFRRHLALMESSGNYAAVNSLGYMGAYQFGMARLADLGLVQKLGSSGLQWKPGYSKERFLADPKLQDDTFKKHVEDLKRRISTYLFLYLSQKIGGVEITISGCVAGAHLAGFQGLTRYLREGIDFADANGTKISRYVKEFGSYKI